MLQVTQKFIGFRQVMKILAADVLLVVKLLQGEEGPARPQPAFFSTIDALQALDQKFNIPDAAAVELYVDRPLCLRVESGPAPSLVNPFSRLQRCFYGGKIHIGSIDVGCNFVGKFS